MSTYKQSKPSIKKGSDAAMERGASPASSVLLRLWRYARPHWKVLLFAVCAMGLVAATEACIPALLKPLLDQGFKAKERIGHLKWFVPLAVIGLAVVRGGAQYASNYLLGLASNHISLNLRVQMFKRILQANAVFFQAETASALINAVIFEVNQVLSIFINLAITLMRDALTVLFLLGYLFYLNWRLTLVVAIIFPVIGGLMSKINRRLRHLNFEHQKLTHELTYVVEETVGGYKVVKVHNGEPYELRRFLEMSQRLRGYAMRMIVSGGLAQPLTQLLASIALAAVITIAVLQSVADQTTVGGFVAFVTAMLLLISPLKHLIDVNQPLQRGVTAAEFIFNLIDEPRVESTGGERPIQRARGKLTFEKVCFRYGSSGLASASENIKATESPAELSLPLVLDQISLVIEPGEVVALVGPSGSGKSTLASLLPRFFDPTAGRILLDDMPVQEYVLADLRRQIALVSQDVVLFNDSIAANIAYGQTPDPAKVWKALQAAWLSDAVAAMPNGIETVIGGNGMKLSGGQRQRLAIARALYKDAPILILDEATSALDAASERHVQSALETLMAGRTTLMIAHRLSTIERADRIVVIDAGRIVESGSHAELLEKEGLYARLHKMQFSQDS